MTPLILASGSVTRAKLLAAAGLEFRVVKPRVDEEAAKASFRAENMPPRALADALAEIKALSVSRIEPGLVIGADQLLELDGQTFDKPADRAAARAHLKALSGKTHRLITAAVIAQSGAPIWREITIASLTMRDLSDAFIEHYLDRLGEGAFTSVGAYQLEGLGAQLFTRIDGDYFTILGLPLLPMLAFLRERGDLPR